MNGWREILRKLLRRLRRWSWRGDVALSVQVIAAAAQVMAAKGR
ncbi:hypothetical protein [Streptomyces sp. MI02-7b]|nr:hypothetical protein [Streptomyces sp. MI02-7b]MDX3075854.1 hypothetical protein [Streptomyces sp. MI02-7b]